jgi:hypothetical protein
LVVKAAAVDVDGVAGSDELFVVLVNGVKIDFSFAAFEGFVQFHKLQNLNAEFVVTLVRIKFNLHPFLQVPQQFHAREDAAQERQQGVDHGDGGLVNLLLYSYSQKRIYAAEKYDRDTEEGKQKVLVEVVPFVVVDAEVDAVVADFFKYLINVFLIDGLSVCVVGVAGQGIVVQLNVPQFRGHIGRVMHRDVREFVHIYTLNIQRTLLYTFNWRFMPRVARLVSFMSGFSLRSLTEVMMRGCDACIDAGYDAGY